MNQFSNLWKDLPKDDLHKTTVDVSRHVFSKLTRVHSKQGVLQTTIYHLINALANELERLNITEYDPGTYEIGVANCTVTLGFPKRESAPEPATGQQHDGPAETAGGNDGHRSPRLARPDEGPTPASDVNESPRKRRGKRSNVKGKEGTSEAK